MDSAISAFVDAYFNAPTIRVQVACDGAGSFEEVWDSIFADKDLRNIFTSYSRSALASTMSGANAGAGAGGSERSFNCALYSELDPGLYLLDRLTAPTSLLADPRLVVTFSTCDDIIIKPNKFVPAHWMHLLADLIEHTCRFHAEIYQTKPMRIDVFAEFDTDKVLTEVYNLNYFVKQMADLNSCRCEFKVILLQDMATAPRLKDMFGKDTIYSVNDFYPGDKCMSEKCKDFLRFIAGKRCFHGPVLPAQAAEGGFNFGLQQKNSAITQLLRVLPGYVADNRFDLRTSNSSNDGIVFRTMFGVDKWYVLMLHFWLRKFGVAVTDFYDEEMYANHNRKVI